MELIHMTLNYSNALLVAILPHISDFAKKLDLPVTQPVTTNQVAWSRPSPYKEFIADTVVLTNHYWFSYSWGCVDGFRSLVDNPFYDDDPAQNWSHYAFGKDNMSTNEAITMAREALKKLGYDLKQFHADDPPTSFHGPANLNDGHHFPYCEIGWDSPEPKTLAEEHNASHVQFQINMREKTLVGMSIISRKIWRDSPKIDVVPELESDYRKRIQSHTNIPVLNLNSGKPPNIKRPSN